MRSAKIVFLIWLLASLALWIRQGNSACIGEMLPLVERSEHLSWRYDLYALAILGIGIAGYAALMAQRPPIPPVIKAKRPPIAVLVGAGFLTVLALAIFERRIHPAIHFNQLAEATGVAEELRYLALLALGVVVFLVMVRWLRDG